MANLSQRLFLRGLANKVLPALPASLQGIEMRQPYPWLVQFHYGEPLLHYEVSRASRHDGWELGFHCESRDKQLNLRLLEGFRRHLFEIKDALGDNMEAEMWDRGWTKIYEVIAAQPLTNEYQAQVGQRLTEIITVLQPIYREVGR